MFRSYIVTVNDIILSPLPSPLVCSTMLCVGRPIFVFGSMAALSTGKRSTFPFALEEVIRLAMEGEVDIVSVSNR